MQFLKLPLSRPPLNFKKISLHGFENKKDFSVTQLIQSVYKLFSVVKNINLLIDKKNYTIDNFCMKDLFKNH